MADWRDRMEAARIELEEARIQWNEAEHAMARATARKRCAERVFHRIFQEKMDELAANRT